MASSHDNLSMAVFCDFENVALGVRDANFEKFDIKPVLEKLLLKGSIVVKKAYCDWDRYKGFKATMHEANFELIEIPHVRQSGKNSADIRMVVDALDLCYTKSHVNTFVIISGDSDFSPLVSKLRENAKQVIGVGVKQSTSDLLVANCDEFIFYDDLVRERQRQAARRQPQQQQPKRSAEESSRKKEEQEARKAEAIEMVVETFDALTSERGDSGKIWASLLKDTLKRRRPDFNETYFGFRTFGNLLEEAQARGLLEFGRDEKSGAYVYRPSGAHAVEVPHVQQVAEAEQVVVQQELEQAEAPAAKGKGESRRRTRGGRKSREEHVEHAEAQEPVIAVMPEPVVEEAPAVTPAEEPAAEASAEESPRRRPARKTPARKAKAAAKAAAEPVEAAPVEVAPEPEPAVEPAEEPAEAAPKRARKPAARPRRPAKPKA